MKKNVAILLAATTWFAILTQYNLIIENKVASIGETTIRFFSFFTILTNLLVAVYFTLSVFNRRQSQLLPLNNPGALTAVTVYITIVGLVYQLILRRIWTPTGLQMIVNELLHSVIPILVIVFWFLYEDKSVVKYKQIPRWLLYPIVYLLYILIRGNYSGFYPYPFVDVGVLGLSKVLINSIGLVTVFIGISALYITIGKSTKYR